MNDDTSLTLSAQDCLVALMIAVSASDEDIRTTELLKIRCKYSSDIFGIRPGPDQHRQSDGLRFVRTRRRA